MSISTKYTLDNLPNSFTVFGAACSDVTTKNLTHTMSTQYNAMGGIGIRKVISKIRRVIISNPSFWTNSVGKDKIAILGLWASVDWGQLDAARRTALFAVTDVL